MNLTLLHQMVNESTVPDWVLLVTAVMSVGAPAGVAALIGALLHRLRHFATNHMP